MANYVINVPTDVRNVLEQATAEVGAAIDTKELPDYPVFVDRLMKPMSTPADELHHACTGISTEAGEILSTSKKVWIYGKELDLANLIEELGDLRFYYQATLNMLGLFDEDIKAQNIIKLRKRYSEGVYSDKAAIARADKQPEPLSAEGSKGSKPVAPRKFMGMEAIPSKNLAEIREDLAKYYGNAPYNTPSNPCVDDEAFKQSLEVKYGMPIEQLRELVL